MQAFTYHSPTSIDEALQKIAGGEDKNFLAGGMTLLPTVKQELAQPSDLIDLAGISELQGINVDGDEVVIGAMTTHAAVASSAAVREKIPALAVLAGGIGDPQVRNRGTIGGSIANADPAADYPAAVVGLNATVVTNQRRIAADDFFVDLFETALEDGELITAVRFPIPGKAAYAKFQNPASKYAVVGVFVSAGSDGVRVAVTGAGASAFRVPDMEAALAASFNADAISGITVDATELNEDMHASSEYRAHLVSVMAARAVNACER